MLDAVAGHAWNPAAPLAKGQRTIGGVFVNWRPDWDGHSAVAANTNIGTTGVSDAAAGAASRHDPLDDLLILRVLDTYLATGAHSAPMDQLRCELSPIVAQEFARYGVDRAWIYGQLIALGQLDSGGAWLSDARDYADLLARSYIDPIAGAERDPRTGAYRSDNAAEVAGALADAGHRFGRPDWLSIAAKAAAYLVTRAANPVTGLFPGTLTVTTGGTQDVVGDPLVKVGSQAQLLDALLSVYDQTGDHSLLTAVQRAAVSLDSPAIGLADPRAGGYFYAADASGTRIRTSYKETRQAWMLPLWRHLVRDGVTGAGQVSALDAFVRDGLFRAGGDGFAYRVAPDLSTFVSNGNDTTVREDFISTEATGIAVVALLGPLS